MPWWQFALLGACGGAIVEVLAIFRDVAAWQDARRNHDGTIKPAPLRLRRYVDVAAHAIMLPARMVLGIAAAVLCGVTGQITGPYGAVVIGCAAPALLAQLGSIPQITKAIDGTSEARKEVAAQRVGADAEDPAEAAVSAAEGGLP
jgi:hypothetical protein